MKGPEVVIVGLRAATYQQYDRFLYRSSVFVRARKKGLAPKIAFDSGVESGAYAARFQNGTGVQIFEEMPTKKPTNGTSRNI